MTALYSDRLVGPTRIAVAGVQQLLCTVPAGRRWVIKRITCAEGGAGTSRVIINMNAVFNVAKLYDLPALAGTDVEARLILYAGEQLWMLQAVAGPTIDITLNGYDFPDP